MFNGTVVPKTAFGMCVTTCIVRSEPIWAGQPVVSTVIGAVSVPPEHCWRSTLETVAVEPFRSTVVVRTCSIPLIEVVPAVYVHPVAAELSTSKRMTYLVVTVAALREAANRSSDSNGGANRSDFKRFIDLSGWISGLFGIGTGAHNKTPSTEPREKSYRRIGAALP